MIRQVAWDSVNSVKNGSAVGTITAVMGRKGTGKTQCLNYLAQYGYESEKLVISTQGLEFTHEVLGFVESNDDRKEGVEIFDQPVYTKDWFGRLCANNESALKKIALKGDYSTFDFEWKEGEVTDERFVKEADTKQRTLYDLVSLGARNVATSADLLYRFVDEIYAISSSEPDVIVIVDDMNFWDHPSEFLHPRRVKPIPSRQLALVDAISKFTKEAPSRSSVFFTMSPRGFMRHGSQHLANANKIVEVEKYTDAELLTALRHYKISRLIEHPTERMDLKWVAWMKGFSGAVPLEVFALAKIL